MFIIINNEKKLSHDSISSIRLIQSYGQSNEIKKQVKAQAAEIINHKSYLNQCDVLPFRWLLYLHHLFRLGGVLLLEHLEGALPVVLLDSGGVIAVVAAAVAVVRSLQRGQASVAGAGPTATATAAVAAA